MNMYVLDHICSFISVPDTKSNDSVYPFPGRMLKIIVGSFRDLRTLNWTETLSMVVSNIVWPLKRYGLLGFLVGIVYWPIALPITLFIGIVYAVPTIYLSIRMIFYSKSAIFERARSRKKNRKYQARVQFMFIFTFSFFYLNIFSDRTLINDSRGRLLFNDIMLCIIMKNYIHSTVTV